MSNNMKLAEQASKNKAWTTQKGLFEQIKSLIEEYQKSDQLDSSQDLQSSQSVLSIYQLISQNKKAEKKPTIMELMENKEFGKLMIVRVLRNLDLQEKNVVENEKALHNFEIMLRIKSLYHKETWKTLQEKLSKATDSLSSKNGLKFDLEPTYINKFIFEDIEYSNNQSLFVYFIIDAIFQFSESIQDNKDCKSKEKENVIMAHYKKAMEKKKANISKWTEKVIVSITHKELINSMIASCINSLVVVFEKTADYYCANKSIFLISQAELGAILVNQFSLLEGELAKPKAILEKPIMIQHLDESGLMRQESHRSVSRKNSVLLQNSLDLSISEILVDNAMILNSPSQSIKSDPFKQNLDQIKIDLTHLVDWMFLTKTAEDEKKSLFEELMKTINDLFQDLNTYLSTNKPELSENIYAFGIIQDIVEKILLKVDEASLKTGFAVSFFKSKSSYLDSILETMKSFIMSKVGTTITNSANKDNYKNFATNYRTLFSHYQTKHTGESISRFEKIKETLAKKEFSSSACVFFINLLGFGFADNNERNNMKFEQKLFFVENFRCVYEQHSLFYVKLTEMMKIYQFDGVLKTTDNIDEYDKVNEKILGFMDVCYREESGAGDCSIQAFHESVNADDNLPDLQKNALSIKSFLINNEGTPLRNLVSPQFESFYNFLKNLKAASSLSKLPDSEAIAKYIARKFYSFNKLFNNFANKYILENTLPEVEVSVAEDAQKSLRLIMAIRAQREYSVLKGKIESVDKKQEITVNSNTVLTFSKLIASFNNDNYMDFVQGWDESSYRNRIV